MKTQLALDFSEETWKCIEGYGGKYQISNLSRVRSFQKKYKHTKDGYGILVCSKRNGYYFVSLYDRYLGKCFYIHRLVGVYFIPNPENKPQINHKDGNKLNNSLNNLEWVTRSENIQHAYDTGLKRKGENFYKSKLNQKQIDSIRKEYSEGKISQAKIGKKYGVKQQTIYSIVRYKNWKV